MTDDALPSVLLILIPGIAFTVYTCTGRGILTIDK